MTNYLKANTVSSAAMRMKKPSPVLYEFTGLLL